MMTFTPANRKFFTQLIGQKANKNENKTNSILGVVWAKRKKRDRRGIWSRQAIKSKSSARSSPERRQHLNFYKLIADVPSAQFPRLIGAVIVYCILVQCFFFCFFILSVIFFNIFFVVCYFAAPTPCRKFCASDREKLVLPAVQPCRRLWRFLG